MTTATTTPSPIVTPAAEPVKAAKPTKPVTAPKAPKASKAAKPAKKAAAEKAPASKPATATKPAKAAAAVKPTKATEPKGKKPKLVRDSFTIPKDEYAVLDTLKDRDAWTLNAAGTYDRAAHPVDGHGAQNALMVRYGPRPALGRKEPGAA